MGTRITRGAWGSLEPPHVVRIEGRGPEFFVQDPSPPSEEYLAWIDEDQERAGSLREVLAWGAPLGDDNEWVEQTAQAIEREATWVSWGRRHGLEVIRGRGTHYHVSGQANRDSITEQGLDWRRKGLLPNVAGASKAELPAIFLQEDSDDHFFVKMAKYPTDLWAVAVDGLWLESGPSGWWIVSRQIEPSRLKIVESFP